MHTVSFLMELLWNLHFALLLITKWFHAPNRNTETLLHTALFAASCKVCAIQSKHSSITFTTVCKLSGSTTRTLSFVSTCYSHCLCVKGWCLHASLKPCVLLHPNLFLSRPHMTPAKYPPTWHLLPTMTECDWRCSLRVVCLCRSQTISL